MAPGAPHPVSRRRPSRREVAAWTVIDAVFFVLGAVGAGWVVWLTLDELVHHGWRYWWLVLVLWLVVAYLLLPRIHTIMSSIYLPDYFIGRARLSDGLLGDPVNIVFRGSKRQLQTAMVRAGWTRADELGFRSGLRIVTSTLRRRSYATAPVSPAFLFGRMQDFTYQQEVDASPARRHHVRFWRASQGWRLPGGAAVDWIGSSSYDRRVGLSLFTLQVTHKIATDTDAERDHIVRTLVAANPEAEVVVIRHFSSGYHSHTGGGDAIETDGDLPVVGLSGIDVGPPSGGSLASASAPSTLRDRARQAIAAARDSGASNRIRRPLTVYFGYVLTLLRAVVAVLTALAGLAGPSWWIAAIVVGGVAYLALAQLTFAGRLIARLATLTLSVAGAIVALVMGSGDGVSTVGGLAAGHNGLWIANLLLDIGILVSLSARDVRGFQLRVAARRRAERAG
jgi:hypothetical protein